MLRLTHPSLTFGSLTIESLSAEGECGEDTAVLRDMVIVVCVMNEPAAVLEGVLRAVPQECGTVVISNSEDTAAEASLLASLRAETGRRLWLVVQHAAGLGEALAASGWAALLDAGGVRMADGKGEAMALGVLCAEALGGRFVGYVDADNHRPETVTEYVQLFAAGLARRRTERCMVRLQWRGKRGPGGNRQDWGRASRISNAVLNEIVNTQVPGAGDAVTTGNAGEFALTMEAARWCEWTTGYGAETFLLLQNLEAAARNDARPPVGEILQIRTRSDHAHTRKSPAHIARLVRESLLPVWHSPLADAAVRHQIEAALEGKAAGGAWLRYPALATAAVVNAAAIFREYLDAECGG